MRKYGNSEKSPDLCSSAACKVLQKRTVKKLKLSYCLMFFNIMFFTPRSPCKTDKDLFLRNGIIVLRLHKWIFFLNSENF